MGSVDQPFRVLSRRAFARTLAGAALAPACATAESGRLAWSLEQAPG